MNEVVLDASALLAILRFEPLALPDSEQEALIGRAIVSAVNFVEVRTKLIDLGELNTAPVEKAFKLLQRIEPFTESQAILAANLRPGTKHLGLSLGDRACLALALETGLEVYTCDQAWSRLTVGCQIQQLR